MTRETQTPPPRTVASGTYGEFIEALTKDLDGAHGGGWTFHPGAIAWSHRPSGLYALYLRGRGVNASLPGGEPVLCSSGKTLPADAALDVAAQLIELARRGGAS